MSTIRPTLIVDTREQDPLTFHNLPSERGTLTTGDYSVRGLEHLLCIERKSLPDLLQCVTSERERFERELHRMQAYRFRHVVIEATAAALERGGWRSKVGPASVYGSVCAWSLRFDVHMNFVGDHDAAGRWVERICFQAARQVARELEACAAFAADVLGVPA